MLRVASSSWQVVGEWALVAHERRPQGDASTGNGGGVVLQRPDEAAGPCTIQVVLLSSGGAAQQVRGCRRSTAPTQRSAGALANNSNWAPGRHKRAVTHCRMRQPVHFHFSFTQPHPLAPAPPW
jgi:hypothetical protein